MLEIKNIHIKFKNTIIRNGNIVVKPHEITLITGESGAGKTSLLNIIGLLDKKNKYEYYYDNRLITPEYINDIHRYKMSYVFQDYNLIEDFTIQENFKLVYNILGLEYDPNEVLDILKKVSINNTKINTAIKLLSGGEKQRVAIALALIKKPRILLLDEPTAHLDTVNSNNIVKILNDLKDEDIMIIISTHNPDIYHAEHIYKIENKKIVEVVSHDQDFPSIERNENKYVKISRRKKFNLFHYSFTHMSHHIFFYMILIFILTWSLFNLTSYYSSISTISEQISEYVNSISDNEILAINKEDIILEEDGWYYSSSGKKFSKEEINNISKINHIEAIYPYYKNVSLLGCDISGTQMNTGSHSKLNVVSYENRNINVTDEFNQTLFVTSCHSRYKERECYEVDEKVNNGIFISSRLAKKLNITQLNNSEISFYMPIYMGYHYSYGYTVDENGKQITENIPTYPDNMFYQKLTYKIKGIFEQTMHDSQFYDAYGESDIYVDYREIERLHNQIVSDKHIMDIYRSYTEKYFMKSHNSQFEIGTPMYIIKVSDKVYMDEVLKQIEQLNYKVNLKTSVTETDSKMNQLNHLYKEVLFLPVIILIIVSLSIAIMYVYTLKKRKKEIALLNVNGIEYSRILPFIDIVIVSFVSLFINIIIFFINHLFLDFSTLAVMLIASSFALIVCLIGNIIYFKKVNIIYELRSY